MPKPDSVIRVFVAGGSQAWGSGAADSSSTFARQIESVLRSEGRPVEALNAAVNGGNLEQVWVLCRDLLRGFQPDILVADAGLNDSVGFPRLSEDAEVCRAAEGTARMLDDLESACREDGADLVLVLEPMCGETPIRPVGPLYEALAATARRGGGTVVKPAGLLSELEKEHFVWWDVAHLAPHGHRRMAELLAWELRPLLDRRGRDAKIGPP